MKLIMTVRPNGFPTRQLMDEAAEEVQRLLPQGFRVQPLNNLSVLVADGPDSVTLAEIRQRLGGNARIGQIVEDFAVQAASVDSERPQD
jgi:hypothetical protein